MAREPRELISVPEGNPRVQYAVGATPQAAFTFPFPYWDDADLAVYTRASTGIVWVERFDYALTAASGFPQTGYASGSVTFSPALENTEVVIVRDSVLDRLSNLPPGQAVDIFALNRDLSRNVGMLQSQRMSLDRALRLPVTEAIAGASDMELPADRALQVLGFDSAGLPVALPATYALEATPLPVGTITAMQLLAVPANGDAVLVTEIGRAGVFEFDTTLVGAADNGITFKATDSTPGSWVRRYSGPVHSAWFGLDNTGAANVFTLLQALIQNHRDVVIDPGTYLCASNLTLYSNTRVRAPGVTINFSSGAGTVMIGLDAITKLDWEGGTMVSTVPEVNQSCVFLQNGATHNRVILDKIQDFRNKGILIRTNSHYNTVQCHDVSGATGLNVGVGINIFGATPDHCKYNTILPSYVHNCRIGISLNGGDYNKIIRPVLVDCELIGFTFDGVVGDGQTGGGDSGKYNYLEFPVCINSSSAAYGGIYYGNGANYNVINGGYSANNLGAGVRSFGGVGFEGEKNVIVGVVCENNALGGFILSGAKGHQLIGCIARNNTTHGFHIFVANNCTISGGIAEGNTGHGLLLQSDECSVFGFHATDNGTYGIRASNGGSAGSNNKFFACSASGNTTADYSFDAGGVVRNCTGFKNEASGTATILDGTNNVVVTHGLDYTPASKDLLITPIISPQSLGVWWAAGITSTQFTINSTNTATINVAFAWQIRQI